MNNTARKVASVIIVVIAAHASNVYANTAPTAGNIGPISAVSEHVCEYQNTYTWKPSVFDADGDPLACRILVAPGVGTATVAADCSSGTYTPPCYMLYQGPVSFSYVANDGTVDSNPGTVNVNVTSNLCSLPSQRMLDPISYTATPGTSVNWFVKVFGTLMGGCKIDSLPLSGTVTKSLTELCAGTYTPAAGFLGQDKFTYSYVWFYEGNFCTQKQIGDIVVTVAKTNPAPTAADVTASGPSTTNIVWHPQVSDPSGDALMCRMVSAPKNGTAYVGPFDCRYGAYYVPAPGFVGTDTFTYVANDGQNDSNVATVTVTVTDPNTPPTAADINLSVISGESVNWTPLATSSSGYILVCRIGTAPVNGIATVDYYCGTGTYQSKPGFIGIDSFTYIATSGGVDSNPGTVTVAVNDGTVDQICVQNNPVSQFTQTGKEGTITISFTGNITSHTNKEVKVCPGTTLSYQTNSTKGPVVCKVKNNTTRGSGILKINDHIKCTDKPAGKDKVHFKVKSGGR